MRVTVNRRACIGSGQCALAAPSVFDQSDEDGIVELLTPEPPENVREAVSNDWRRERESDTKAAYLAKLRDKYGVAAGLGGTEVAKR